jgi:hypothetical protein
MSHDIAERAARTADQDALGQVFRRLGALHATLAEADRVDEGLQRRTLDRLMDTLELIEEASRPKQATRQLCALAFFPCERVKPTQDGHILFRPLAGGEASHFPAQTDLTIYGRFAGAVGAYAIDLLLANLTSGNTSRLTSAGITVDDADEVGDFAIPMRVSFPRPGKYELRFVANGTLVATHPWLATLTPVA